MQTVRSVFEEYFCIYGCTKLLRELNDRSVDINEYKLRRIMRENGLYSVVVKKFKPYRPGKSDGMYAENLLQRNFAPFGLNQYWCGDITYIRTNLGWVYLAVVNRGKHENLVFHSDRGTQYSSRDGELLRQLEEGIFRKPRVARTNSFVLMTEAQK